jgi:hypothetical protein
MSTTTALVKAELQELDEKFENPINEERWTTVQFNPETLKVSFANQIATQSGAGDQNGPAPRQFVGAGTTKLTLQLWFDITGELPEGLPKVDDVRRLTQRVTYFITPKKISDNPLQFVPPAVRFSWGMFQFDGMMDSVEESLEFFSGDGRALRASMSLAMSQQRITEYAFGKAGSQSGAGALLPGTTPLTQARAGDSVQQLAAGKGADWRAVATANGIENPRLLAPGQLLNMNAGVRARPGRLG